MEAIPSSKAILERLKALDLRLDQINDDYIHVQGRVNVDETSFVFASFPFVLSSQVETLRDYVENLVRPANIRAWMPTINYVLAQLDLLEGQVTTHEALLAAEFKKK